jgi:hypothetical protein
MAGRDTRLFGRHPDRIMIGGLHDQQRFVVGGAHDT